jgi:hypothetical protein
VTARATTSLRTLQRSFARVMRGGKARLALAGDDRRHVYVEAYTARLVEVLAGDYGATKANLGEESFAALAERYVREHPSRHPNLNVFGRNFPAFLRRQRGVSPLARDLARLELALTRAFDATAAPPLAVDTLATTPPARLAKARLTVHPSVQLLRLSAAAADAFATWRNGVAAPVTPRRGVVELLVVRGPNGVERHELRRDAARVLRALQRGAALGRALEGVRPDAPLAQWFATWRAAGVFAG